jgi:hypothetical protein
MISVTSKGQTGSKRVKLDRQMRRSRAGKVGRQHIAGAEGGNLTPAGFATTPRR